MWKISRNLVFPRWHFNKQKPPDNSSKNPTCVKATAVRSSFFDDKKHSNKNSEKDQNYKESKTYWNCNQFQFLLSKSFFIETAGWLGAVTALCFNFHFKHFNSFYKFDKSRSPCLFSRNVLAMPKTMPRPTTSAMAEVTENFSLEPPLIFENEPKRESSEHSDCLTKAMELQRGTQQYAASAHCSEGLSLLDSNCKKAFRCFQAAARLGSSQGLYNLGLCYELGKGTKVNLSRAAFCYRKAAMKGHGEASFNLAVYFLKGIGGLPVDPETAQLLLAEAAEKGVPEAEKYLGLECLENERWSEAYEIFHNLDKKNDLDGKYYLGLCHENGWGIDKNEQKAAEIFFQAAASGHVNSTLKLSKCYEEGSGGCDKDLDFAQALCQIIADQGNTEAMLSLARLKIKQESVKNGINSKSSFKYEKSNIHNSSSAPQIHRVESANAKTSVEAFTSAYLGLITPFFSVKETPIIVPKSTFFIGDEGTSSSFISSNHMNQLQLVHSCQ